MRRARGPASVTVLKGREVCISKRPGTFFSTAFISDLLSSTGHGVVLLLLSHRRLEPFASRCLRRQCNVAATSKVQQGGRGITACRPTRTAWTRAQAPALSQGAARGWESGWRPESSVSTSSGSEGRAPPRSGARARSAGRGRGSGGPGCRAARARVAGEAGGGEETSREMFSL